MAEHNELGKAGEKKAAGYLRKLGHEILATNWRCGSYEIDLISKTGNVIVITEVKTRNQHLENTEDVMSFIKLGALRNAADQYMQQAEGGDELECRVDLLLLEKNGNSYTYRHFESAIQP